jgi:hypothetical protein
MDTSISNDVTTAAAATRSSVFAGSGCDGVLIVVDEGDFKGMTMITDRQTGDVVGITSKNCSNENKRSDMPLLNEYPELKVVDFHGQRYMTSINETICVPTKMERLILSRMDSLQRLHPAIGNLHHLVEVRGRNETTRSFCDSELRLLCSVFNSAL